MAGLSDSPDPLIKFLRNVIRFSVRILAILMTILILVGTIDVGWTLFGKMLGSDPIFVLSISDILATFGAFMAVLIAIEIFINITMYLRDDVIHVKIVIATAIMAISRKVIIFDYKTVEQGYVWASAVVILASCAGYWLVSRSGHDDDVKD